MVAILVSDIDGTLTGDPASLLALSGLLARRRAAGELVLVLCTGRDLDGVIRGFDEEGLPPADAVIAQVGTEVFLPPFRRGMAPDREWQAMQRREFDRDLVVAAIAELAVSGLELQDARWNTPLKVSYDLRLEGTASATAVAAVRETLTQLPQGRHQVVFSSGRHLDILPAASGKGAAARSLIQRAWPHASVAMAAGDSGNDEALFRALGRGVAVANATPELRAFVQRHGSEQVVAQTRACPHCQRGVGVLETSERVFGHEYHRDSVFQAAESPWGSLRPRSDPQRG